MPEPVVESRASRRRRQAEPALVDITGEGFVPSEDISCALILTRTDAAPDGTARALLDTNQLTGGADGTLRCPPRDARHGRQHHRSPGWRR